MFYLILGFCLNFRSFVFSLFPCFIYALFSEILIVGLNYMIAMFIATICICFFSSSLILESVTLVKWLSSSLCSSSHVNNSFIHTSYFLNVISRPRQVYFKYNVILGLCLVSLFGSDRLLVEITKYDHPNGFLSQ